MCPVPYGELNRLYAGVLFDAIRTYIVYLLPPAANPEATRNQQARRRHRIQLGEKEIYWFESNDKTNPYSFLNTCWVLGYDPDALREKLKDGETLQRMVVEINQQATVRQPDQTGTTKARRYNRMATQINPWGGPK